MSGLECGPAVVPQRDYLILAKLEGGRLEATRSLTAALNWTHHLEKEVWKAIGKAKLLIFNRIYHPIIEFKLVSRFCA